MGRYKPGDEIPQDVYLTDEELEELGFEIPEDETDGTFFDSIDEMIAEEFADVEKK